MRVNLKFADDLCVLEADWGRNIDILLGFVNVN